MNLICLRNALVIAPVSMAKIEGAQSARRTINIFTDLLLPYAPDDENTADVAVVTTEGLYLNNSSESAYALREKLWVKGDKFRRQFVRGIVEAPKKFPRILPAAYEISTFDTYRAAVHEDFRKIMGFLANQAQTNITYKQALVRDLEDMNQPDRPDKIAFLHEEFAWGWLAFHGKLPMRTMNPLRRHANGQIIMCYAGGFMPSWGKAFQLLSHATQTLPEGRAIWVDTSTQQDFDMAETVHRLDQAEPVGPKKIKLGLSCFQPRC